MFARTRRGSGAIVLRLHGSVTFDRHALPGARVRPIVPQRTVLGAAVVPEGDRARLPAETALEQRVLHMLVQVPQDGVALVDRHAEDARGEAAVDVERLLPGPRMRSDHRVLGARIAWPVGLAGEVEQPAI